MKIVKIFVADDIRDEAYVDLRATFCHVSYREASAFSDWQA
jgi:hypothetical protein